MTSLNRTQIEKAIAALEAQRRVLGDAVTDAAIAPLAAQLDAGERRSERKQVSVLFADVAGFTALSETLDPEEVRDALDRVWTLLDGRIEAHGGHIDKHIGDAVMAVFGVPTAREDDAERAVRAALDMQGAMATLDLPVAVRIGVHTGPALLGEVATTAEYTVLGDTVNLASRLETAAPVGGILISAATERQVRGIFETERQAPIEVKGKSQPVQTYRVLKERPAALRRRTRGLTGAEAPGEAIPARGPFVGRDREIRQMGEAARAAAQDRTSRLLVVTGEAGIGKTRMVEEFLASLPAVLVVRGRGEAWRRDTPYGVIRTMLAPLTRALNGGDRVAASDEAANGTRSDAATALAGDLAQLAGLASDPRADVLEGIVDEPEAVREWLANALTTALRRLAHAKQLVVFLDDLHWADASSVELLGEALSRSRDAGILVLATARPEGVADAGSLQLSPEAIALAPLQDDEAREFVERVFGADLVEALAGQVARSEGNPFFLEEIFESLIEAGVLAKAFDGWHLEAPPPSAAGDRHASASGAPADVVPPALVAVLQARLDRRPPREQRVLDAGAVFGRTFWEAEVRSAEASAADRSGSTSAAPSLDTADRSGSTSAAPSLDAAAGAGLLEEVAADPFPESRAFGFTHALLHEVAYERVLLADRRRLHRLAARWLAADPRGRSGMPAAIGRHLLEAGDAAGASGWFARAGTAAMAAFANREAADLFQVALDIVEAAGPASTSVAAAGDLADAEPGTGQPAPPARFDLLSNLEDVEDRLGKRTSQRARLDKMDVAARSDEERVAVLLRRSRLLWSTDDLAAARPVAERALEVARGLDRPDLEAAILRQLGRIARDLGDLDGAQTRFEAAAQAFQRAGSEAERGNLLIQMGAVESERGAWAAARELLLQGLRESEAGGRVLDEAWALDNLAIVEACVGRLGDALDRGRAALSRAEATGGAARILASRLNLAGIMIRAGANAEAARLTESALALAEEIEDLPASVLGHLDRSEVLHRQGDTSGAVEAAEAALEVADRVGAPHLTVFARLGLSDAVRGREPERAAQLARDALAAATGMAAEPLVTLAQRSLAEALLADGDLRGAEEASQAAASALDAGGVAEGLEAQVYLTRYRTLVAAGNPSAAETLAKAQAIAAEIGSTLPDPDLREAFWSDVPAHAAIRRAVDDGESGVAPAEHP